MRKAKHNAGFTLFELMVVLALMAVAAALVAPSMAHAFGNMELRTGATSVTSLMAQARSHAVYEARSYAVVFSPKEDAARSLYLVRDDGRQAQHVTLPAHITLQAQNADGSWSEEPRPVYFFSDGTSQLLQLDLRGERNRHVQVALDPLTARARVTQIYDGEVQP